MANTWQGRLGSSLPPAFGAAEGDGFTYEFARSGEAWTYSVNLPSGPGMTLPVETSLGGRRHGLGFLVSMRELDGLPLARPALIQARYAWSPEKKKLLLAPGCSNARPRSLESALGLVLSPTFESRCLDCHGQPNLLGSGKNGGVHCESCHGQGQSHLTAIGRGTPRQGIVNPARLSTEDSIAVCARCHVGLTRFSDPSADDLLIANQVRAIKTSECFRQSRNAFSCITCHDPHGDAEADDKRTVDTCLGCHSGEKKLHAAICPVNSKTGCIGCHMPATETGPLRLVDHLIRVHPEQEIQATSHPPELETRIRPVSEYLRMISTNSGQAAATARDRLNRGESFYAVAREVSVDRSAPIGGYLGLKALADLNRELPDEAARLGYGEIGQPMQSGTRWIILQRLPRDFRWDAEQLQLQAENLAARGDAQDAIEKSQAALMIYPQFLRAINFIGTTFAQSGNPKKAAEVLATAARLYPDDAKTQFALAATLGLLNDWKGAAEAYKRVISLEPDFTAAYVSLGMISYSSDDWQSAIKTFHEGLQIDPLSAELYYDLGLALTRSGDAAAGSNALTLARKLDPDLFERRKASAESPW